MKINAQTLLKAIDSPVAIASKKTTLPILNHLLLSADNGKLTVTATNLEVFQQVVVECSGSLPPLCVSASMFRDILRGFSGDAEIKQVKKKIEVSGSHNIKLVTMDAEEFVAFPSDKAEPIAIDCAEVSESIQKVAWSVSTDNSRETLQNVCVLGGDCLATDGRTIALVSMACSSGKSELLVHSLMVPVLCNALNTKGAAVSLSEKYIFVTHDAGKIAVKRSESRYPNVIQYVPKNHKPIGSVSTEALRDVLKIATSLYDEKCTFSDFVFSKDGCAVSHKGVLNEFASTVPGKFKELTIRLNGRYVLSAVNMLGGEVEALAADELAPILLRSGKSLAVIMPLRLN